MKMQAIGVDRKVQGMTAFGIKVLYVDRRTFESPCKSSDFVDAQNSFSPHETMCTT